MTKSFEREGGGGCASDQYFFREAIFFRQPAEGGNFWDFSSPRQVFLTENITSGRIMSQILPAAGEQSGRRHPVIMVVS